MILHNENREHLSDGESLFELLLLCRIRTFGHRHSVALAAAAVVVGEGTCASNNSMYIVHVRYVQEYKGCVIHVHVRVRTCCVVDGHVLFQFFHQLRQVPLQPRLTADTEPRCLKHNRHETMIFLCAKRI